jgi:hypothetical protein
MEGDVIKSFLVGLGFGVDDASLAKFNKAIATASIKVAALYAGIQTAATGIFAGIAKISAGFEEMGYSLRLVAPAVNKMLILRQAMLTTYAKAGIDLRKVVRDSILFNYSLAKTKFALEAIYKSVGAKFLPLLTKQMDIFRLKIFQNMPKIQAVFKKFIEATFKAFQLTVQFGGRLYEILSKVWDFFAKLDEATGGWSTKIIAVIAAWKLLNLEFLATPLGMLIAGITALILLWDDFKVWKEGGKSLFNWGYVVPIINAVSDALSILKKVLDQAFQNLFELTGAFVDLFHLDFKRLQIDFENLFGGVGKQIQSAIELLKSFGGLFSSITGFAADMIVKFSGGSVNPPNIQQPGPLLPTSHTNNATLHQQTNININGTADAHAAGKAAASEQNNVNQTATRNLSRYVPR